ncbi:hypothetical protein PR002_g30197 [Phytophthora rubi]|uniref:Reverse transcriptase domain-containing protein n=1 Tax=Phytophthora rubi TaxID=129364 RepID=A0A6A3GU96_9STRA|nr:hypothetical protein PR002_g30197 [Phytophthora rubi]
MANSGIRQGCPLAPLLFLLAVDTLGQTFNRHPDLQGISLPGSASKPHKFSAFVDDSTVFMRSVRELDVVKRILEDFGAISGLKVQPQKSIVIGDPTGRPIQCSGTTSNVIHRKTICPDKADSKTPTKPPEAVRLVGKDKLCSDEAQN